MNRKEYQEKIDLINKQRNLPPDQKEDLINQVTHNKKVQDVSFGLGLVTPIIGALSEGVLFGALGDLDITDLFW